MYKYFITILVAFYNELLASIILFNCFYTRLSLVVTSLYKLLFQKVIGIQLANFLASPPRSQPLCLPTKKLRYRIIKKKKCIKEGTFFTPIICLAIPPFSMYVCIVFYWLLNFSCLVALVPFLL